MVCDWLRQDERWRNLAKHRLEDIVGPEKLWDWLAAHGREIDAIVHMGAISATTETDVDAIVENNVRLSNDLWDWATRQQKPLVYASSAATYGDGRNGFRDDARPDALASLRPLNAYGWSKHVVDRRVAEHLRNDEPHPPQWVGIKFFNVFGPNEYHKGSMKSVIAQNATRAAKGDAIRLFRSYRSEYADGGQLRDFIYVRDCVDVITWFLEHPDCSGLYNLGTGQARSWLDLAGSVFAALNLPAKVEFIDMPVEIREKYQYFTRAEMTKLREAGYSAPFTSLEDSVADYVRKYLTGEDPYR